MDGEGEEEDDISHHFYPRARLDSLLQVPDLASVGTIDTEDMAEMMKINREMLDIKELSQDDIDSLLNIDSFYPTNTNMSGESARASNEGYPKAPEGFTITEKAPTRVISTGLLLDYETFDPILNRCVHLFMLFTGFIL